MQLMERSSHDEFNGQRVRLARRFRGLSLRKLGELVATSTQHLSNVERGQANPSDMLVAALGDALGFTPEHFYKPIARPDLRPRHRFRKKASTPKIYEDMATSRTSYLDEFLEYLEAHVELPKPAIPRVPANRLSAEQVATETRLQMGLENDSPVLSVMRALENHGCVAQRYSDKVADKIDAFSVVGFRPLMILNRSVSSSRDVWSAAHELGHIVMHGGPTGDVDIEQEANDFASAFLLPRLPFTREFPRSTFDWGAIFELKQRWRTSAAAIVRRAWNLQLIDAAQYMRAYKHISRMGWRTKEPHEFPSESPEIIPAGIQILQEDVAKADLLEHLGWKEETLADITQAHWPDQQTAEVHPISDYRQDKD